MSIDVVRAAAGRIHAYTRKFGIRNVVITLKGGDPLIAGKSWFREAVPEIRKAVGDASELTLALITDGDLLDEGWIDLFREFGILVSIHIENGRGLNAMRSLELVQGLGRHFGGILYAIHPAEDGLTIYRDLLAIGINRMDFLLPAQYNWDHPPPAHLESKTPYADYLIPIFDEWWREPDGAVSVRLFESLLELIVGSRNYVDGLGGDPVTTAVIESDGSIVSLDTLRACAGSMTQVKKSVFADSIYSLYAQPVFKKLVSEQESLCAICKSCALHDTCGGGPLPTRYSSLRMLDSPSVLCADLWRFISHIIAACDTSGDSLVRVPGPALAATVPS